MSAPGALPTVTSDQMREVDRILVEEVGLQLVQMMENAGRHLADVAVERFGPRRCTVLAGSGGNGGGGMVAARHLHNRGIEVTVVPTRTTAGGVTGGQLELLRRFGLDVVVDPVPADLVVDAVLGYGVRGNPKGRAGQLVAWAAAAPGPVLSLDLPSGLDATTGVVGDPCVHADVTLALGLPKAGLLAAPVTVRGHVLTADIGIPDRVYERVGVAVDHPFRSGSVVTNVLE